MSILKSFFMAILLASVAVYADTKPIDMHSFFYYEDVAMNRFGGESYKVERADGKALITIDEDHPLSGTIEADAGIFNEIQNIVDKYNMHKYKAEYKPDMPVFDGGSWALGASYDDKNKNIRSRGINEAPKNAREAFGAIEALFQPYRDKLWKGTYAGGNQGQKDGYSLSIGKIESDGATQINLSLVEHYEIVCKGIVRSNRVDIYFTKVTKGEFINLDGIDNTKPLFMLFRGLDLKDNQGLKIFGKNENYVYFKKVE
ncbi:DUF5991 domain-containing protein [Campylobacter californiensis]|uniref:DUF5991 domain-containing protein n=2 Tax=Campylobacter TaxID=194 RepID=UPI0014730943|nr:DUF5991 domain-containing protein [Campylobacter sp. RM12916]MBE3610013.1 hypothetical protein [Campylobacter sp. RM12916]